jgi:hypothetical protein
MAEQLGRFIPLVGGPSFAYALLDPLEVLSTVEETVVRDAALAALNAVVAEFPQEHVARHAWPLVKRLGTRDWFTSRTSACGLVARLLARLPPRREAAAAAAAARAGGGAGPGAGASSESKDAEAAAEGDAAVGREDVLELYTQLCNPDEEPMVRRAAASALADVGTAVAGGTLASASSASSRAGAGHAGEGKSSEEDVNNGPGGGGPGAALAGGLLGAEDAGAANESVPPAVPKAVTVSCASQAAGRAAAAQLLPLLQAFARDDQDGVRLLAVDGCVALARLVNGGMASALDGEGAAALGAGAEERASVLSVLSRLCTDRAWRVRWSAANRLSELADALGKALSTEQLLPRFTDLLSDGEAEVRTAASYRVADIGRAVGQDRVLESLVPAVSRVSEDPSEHVRAALSSVVLGLAPVLGTAATIDSLLPLFLRLLKDSSAAVRLNIISKLEAVNAVIGLKMLSQSLLPAIQELSADRSWRVRQAIIDFTPLLAKQLGHDVFDSAPELTDLCLSWLTDSVFSVREAATANLKKLAEVSPSARRGGVFAASAQGRSCVVCLVVINGPPSHLPPPLLSLLGSQVFGPAWADKVIIPRLLALKPEDSRTAYQLRMTSLQAMVVRWPTQECLSSSSFTPSFSLPRRPPHSLFHRAVHRRGGRPGPRVVPPAPRHRCAGARHGPQRPVQRRQGAGQAREGRRRVRPGRLGQANARGARDGQGRGRPILRRQGAGRARVERLWGCGKERRRLQQENLLVPLSCLHAHRQQLRHEHRPDLLVHHALRQLPCLCEEGPHAPGQPGHLVPARALCYQRVDVVPARHGRTQHELHLAARGGGSGGGGGASLPLEFPADVDDVPVEEGGHRLQHAREEEVERCAGPEEEAVVGVRQRVELGDGGRHARDGHDDELHVPVREALVRGGVRVQGLRAMWREGKG